ncbi:MAG TPA: ribbon-helix-helix domain-containing protein [Xanthobacteraceae bacterium]|jgi:predicted DNA-binding ribbon-helix-helix protein|nr:ribbon-helix-helix domain-containing protein [Xanthobacteraceae bacterium]
MRSPVAKRSVVLSGHKTSVSLEDAFWKELRQIAGARDMTASDLVAEIDAERQHGNLSSALRLFVLDFYRQHITAAQAAGGKQRDGDHASHGRYHAAPGKARG